MKIVIIAGPPSPSLYAKLEVNFKEQSDLGVFYLPDMMKELLGKASSSIISNKIMIEHICSRVCKEEIIVLLGWPRFSEDLGLLTGCLMEQNIVVEVIKVLDIRNYYFMEWQNFSSDCAFSYNSFDEDESLCRIFLKIAGRGNVSNGTF